MWTSPARATQNPKLLLDQLKSGAARSICQPLRTAAARPPPQVVTRIRACMRSFVERRTRMLFIIRCI
eukprot:5986150-Amphidinium_carterae.1